MKKYSDLEEEEEKVRQSKKTFISLLSSWKNESFKDSTFIVFLKYFIHLPKNIHSSDKKNIKKYSDLREEKMIRHSRKLLYLYCCLQRVFFKYFIHLAKNIHSSKEKTSKNIQIIKKKKISAKVKNFVPLLSSSKSESFNIYCVLLIFISKQKHEKVFRSWRRRKGPPE